MAYQQGEIRDAQGNIVTPGSWGVKSSPKVSIPIIIEDLRALKDDGITAPANFDASKVTSGVFDIARIPAAALERIVSVANQTARFALTTASVQVGDCVLQLDTSVMYWVIDTDNLGNENGYHQYNAGTAASVPWSGVTGKPTTVDISGLTDAVSTSVLSSTLESYTLNTDSRLTDARTPVTHTQAWSTITATPTTVAGYGITDVYDKSTSDGKYAILDATGKLPLSILPTEISVGIAGLEWDRVTDTYTRLGTARGQSRVYFDSISPWKDMKRCNLSDTGTVNAYYGDPTYKDDGSNGMVMVEIPLFYSRTDYDGNKIHWYVSDKPFVGAKVNPSFITGGVTKQKIYFSAFEGFVNGTKLESKTGVQPTANYNIAQFRTFAQARGAGWQQQTFHAVSAIQMLFAIEYASFDTQGCIGRGVVDIADNGSTNMSVVTGATASLGNASGMATGTNGLVSVSYRGVENFWGNIWKFVDGINIKNYVPYIADNGYVSDKFDSPYTALNGSLPTANGYMSDIINYDSGFLPLKATGSSTTRFYDYYTCPPNTGNFVVILGGYWSYAGNAGAFDWYSNSSSGYLYRTVASRLLFV